MAPAVGTFSDLVDIVIATEACNSLEQRQSLSASVVQLTPSTVFQSDEGITVGGLRNYKSDDKNLLPGNADAGEPSREEPLKFAIPRLSSASNRKFLGSTSQWITFAECRKYMSSAASRTHCVCCGTDVSSLCERRESLRHPFGVYSTVREGSSWSSLLGEDENLVSCIFGSRSSYLDDDWQRGRLIISPFDWITSRRSPVAIEELFCISENGRWHGPRP